METQYRAVIMQNDDQDYTVALRIDATSILDAAVQAEVICQSDWVNMRVVSVEEVNAIPL